jgi:hypothetical protein
MTAPRRRGLVVFGWCALYALLCALEFVLGKCKDAVEQRIWPEEDDDAD